MTEAMATPMAREQAAAERPPVVVVTGPTASGKSALAMALAARFPVEIVSVDSAQVYRGMDIGTAKPDPATRARVPHHLIDIIDPVDAYSAARFRADALAAIAAARARGAVPLVVGGTMLYFKALLEGLSALPAANPAVRAGLDARAATEGWPALHAELARVDPGMAARLKVTDAQRIQRALEVYAIAGRPLSGLQGAREAGDALGRTIAIALLPGDRARLHREIAARFDAMLSAGLVAEVAGLRARFALGPELPSMRCVGYRQAWQFLEGRIDAAALRASGIAATRQLAKRQFTWLRATLATVFEPAAPGLADAVAAFLLRAGLRQA
jgi:tRNA dimethylallyltransferase